MKTIASIVATLVWTGLTGATFAQDVSIPDPGLDAAIRETLQKPEGPLTEQDLLSLINLDAGFREVSNTEGLETARNLERLFLDFNRLTNFSLPGTLTNLIELRLGNNPLTTCSLPGGVVNLDTLDVSTDLAAWSELGATTNTLGSIVFSDATAALSTRKFYRARQ